MSRTGSVTPERELTRISTWLEQQIDDRLTPLLSYAEQLAALSSASSSGGLTAGDVESLSQHVEAIIKDSPAIIGSGYIAAPGAVDDAIRYMLWLQQRGDAIKRLQLNFDTTDLEAYDYVEMDWYLRTRDRLRPTLIGPYLDYSGSDALVITLAVPVLSGAEFLGVVAIDLMAQAAEELITNELCQLPGDVVVVNRDRTVVATNSVRWMPGERLASMPDEDEACFKTALQVGDWSDWQIAVAKP
ncbi:PDC sensor domain-containing protein [Nocardioides daeguensis]|uniref:Cache domain-containing protein n=1 Tax=Nocardioides daeguensis TaxID=908359 RepID=A0ABP6VTS6_9ACTN|nr:cache domain-containing protein [Nocardioides daeguensis]MBV6729730.1 cache domain-containing protein [Nocardioides daeguensis]MCR1772457.1 cache domain-containing protein [Nocardioides daeguensis]